MVVWEKSNGPAESEESLMIWFFFGLLAGIAITYLYSFIKRKSSEEAEDVTENEKRVLELVENTKDCIYYFETKPKWRYKFVYPSFEKIFGPEVGKTVYDNPQLMLNRVHPDDYEMLINKINGQVDYEKPIIYRIMNNQGQYVTFEEFTTPVYRDGEVVAIQGILRNITEKLKLQQELEYRSTHDSLTALYNREYFEQMVEKFDKEVDLPVAIVLFDLDELKEIKDTFGHKKGDLLIKEAAKLLNEHSSDEIIVSRIGGDEYSILITNKGENQVVSLLQSISNEIMRYNESSTDITIKMSIGYACSNHSLGKMDGLFMEADQNMYKEKSRKKGRIEAYSYNKVM